MAMETVEAVRQAELNAAQKEKDALNKKDEIISEAGRNAKALAASRTKQAMEEAEQELEAANQKGNGILQAAKLKAEKEVLIMREMAKAREEAVINMVLQAVINGKQ